MPNILTITPPLESHFDHKLPPVPRSFTTTASTHTPSTIPTPLSYYNERPDAARDSHLPPPPPYHPRDNLPSDMATTHAHRGLGGLPPPSSMTLPDPSRGHGQPLPETRDMGQSYPPAPPRSSWHREEESTTKEWHRIRAEEEKRKAEEERTRQEQLRLEQRQIEHTMLRDAIHAQIPPHLVPMIFAGLSGGPVAQANFDMAQQYLNDLKQQNPIQHHVAPSQHTSPEARIDARPAHYNPHHPGAPQTVGPPPPPQGAPGQVIPSQIYPSPAYASPQDSRGKTLYGAPSQYGPLPQAKGSSALGALPRLTTHESASIAPSTQQNRSQQDQPESSPITFQHWQPPSNKDSGSGSGKDSTKPSPTNLPNTNASRTQQSVAQPQHSSHQNSPRKRKAVGSHEAAPAPTSAGSPSFAITSAGGNGKAQKGNRSRNSTVSSTSGPPRRGYDPIRNETESKRYLTHSREASVQPRGSEVGNLRHEESQSNPATPQRQASEPADQDKPRT